MWAVSPVDTLRSVSCTAFNSLNEQLSVLYGSIFWFKNDSAKWNILMESTISTVLYNPDCAPLSLQCLDQSNRGSYLFLNQAAVQAERGAWTPGKLLGKYSGPYISFFSKYNSLTRVLIFLWFVFTGSTGILVHVSSDTWPQSYRNSGGL